MNSPQHSITQRRPFHDVSDLSMTFTPMPGQWPRHWRPSWQIKTAHGLILQSSLSLRPHWLPPVLNRQLGIDSGGEAFSQIRPLLVMTMAAPYSQGLNFPSVYGISFSPSTHCPGHHPHASYGPASTLEHAAWLLDQTSDLHRSYHTSQCPGSLPGTTGQPVEDRAVAPGAVPAARHRMCSPSRTHGKNGLCFCHRQKERVELEYNEVFFLSG